MNTTDKTKLNGIRSRIMLACEQYALGKFSHKQWKEMLEFAIKESVDIVHPHAIALDNDSSAKASLKQWSKDCRVIDWCHQHHVLLTKNSKKFPWRWIDSDEIPGMINGFPTCRGIPRITNGILVYLERGDGSTFLGHMDWFMPDMITKATSTKTQKTKNKRAEIEFAELFVD